MAKGDVKFHMCRISNHALAILFQEVARHRSHNQRCTVLLVKYFAHASLHSSICCMDLNAAPPWTVFTCLHVENGKFFVSKTLIHISEADNLYKVKVSFNNSS